MSSAPARPERRPAAAGLPAADHAAGAKQMIIRAVLRHRIEQTDGHGGYHAAPYERDHRGDLGLYRRGRIAGRVTRTGWEGEEPTCPRPRATRRSASMRPRRW